MSAGERLLIKSTCDPAPPHGRASDTDLPKLLDHRMSLLLSVQCETPSKSPPDPD